MKEDWEKLEDEEECWQTIRSWYSDDPAFRLEWLNNQLGTNMNISDIRFVFEGGQGEEFRVTYYTYDNMRGTAPITNTFTLLDIERHGVVMKTEYNQQVFISFSRIYEVHKIL